MNISAMNGRITDKDLPPVVKILISEGLHELPSADALYRALADGGLWNDLCAQAQGSIRGYEYEEFKPQSRGQLVFTPSASLDPFSNVSKCSSISCRLSLADSFVRSLGLYADRIVVTDYFTSAFLQTDRASRGLAEELFKDLAILRKLLLFIKEGVIKFGTPAWAFATCIQKSFTKLLDKLVRHCLRRSGLSLR